MENTKDIKNIKEIALEFLAILKKHYPEVVDKTYDSFGYPDKEGSPALERAELVIYFELMKAGAFSKA